tara:strand:- start:5829 stop:5942 length:114 start_codon:yes stop_codon:yes gene_type:complete
MIIVDGEEFIFRKLGEQYGILEFDKQPYTANQPNNVS